MSPRISGCGPTQQLAAVTLRGICILVCHSLFSLFFMVHWVGIFIRSFCIQVLGN